MRILFLNPGVMEMAAYQCLSSYLKSRGSFTTKLIVDPRMFVNPYYSFKKLDQIVNIRTALLEEIVLWKPDCIAVTMVSDDYTWVKEWALDLKKYLSVPIVTGNIHPTTMPDQVLGTTKVDFLVMGEGEETFYELLMAIQEKRDLSQVKGIAYKEEGRIFKNEMRPLIENLDTLPYPDKDLTYQAMPYANHGYTTMSGRGCPYRCSFCDNTTAANLYKESEIKTKWTRRHSPEYMVEEILWAKKKYDFRHIRFNDEDFSYHKKWLKEFCPLYKEKVDIPYFAWVYPSTITDETAALLAQSGCDAVEMGVQSGSSRIRSDIANRFTSNEQIINAMLVLRKYKIRCTVDIIIGFPTETEDDLKRTALLLAEGKPWHLYAFHLRYYPSTEIYKMAKDQGLISQHDIAMVESGELDKGHIAGLENHYGNKITKRYHTFFLLIPLLPTSVIKLIVNLNLVKFVPIINSVLLVNITKMIKRNKYDEFRIRWAFMLLHEIPRIIKLAIRSRILSKSGNLTPIKFKS